MSVTEELRALLDARGVEWSRRATAWRDETIWKDARGRAVCTSQAEGTDAIILKMQVTPAQAVEATLGRETCKDMSGSAKHADVAFECSECGCWVAYDEFWDTRIYVCAEGQPMHIHPHFCPYCGREVVE